MFIAIYVYRYTHTYLRFLLTALYCMYLTAEWSDHESFVLKKMTVCWRGQPARCSACLVQAPANLTHMFHRRSLDVSFARRRKRAMMSAAQNGLYMG